jgi:pyruvate,orthophosphate dikinase
VALAAEGIISKEEAVKRVTPAQVVNLLVPQFTPESRTEASRAGRLLATGLGASPGAAVGRAVFDAHRAAAMGEQGDSIILVRPETNPDDVPGVLKAKGVLTARGGNSSHAAVVARGLGKPAVVACSDIDVDVDNALMRVNGLVLREGEEISIDGATGEVFTGAIETREPRIEDQHEMQTLLQWADDFRHLGVRANADTPEDARAAVALGAEGIGLCRTEHMLLYGPRLALVRKALLASGADEASRRTYLEALNELEQYHEGDFGGIFEIMAGKPVIVRLLDAPLHEFLPRHEDLLRDVARLEATGQSGAELEEKRSLLRVVEDLREQNPMLGHRGCRLGMTHPEFYDMQVRAIVTAAAKLVQQGIEVIPEIMVPLVSNTSELHLLRERLMRVVEDVQQREGVNFHVPFGTMIETPRAALISGQLAHNADFFSFGSNDLTQMSWGFSRDDAEGKFLRHYIETGVLANNPFVTLDKDGVGRLISMSTTEGRSTRSDLEVGVCGEHGGDPESIIFCHQVGLNYVSASPYRVPVARIVAAQAALGVGEGTA